MGVDRNAPCNNRPRVGAASPFLWGRPLASRTSLSSAKDGVQYLLLVRVPKINNEGRIHWGRQQARRADDGVTARDTRLAWSRCLFDG